MGNKKKGEREMIDKLIKGKTYLVIAPLDKEEDLNKVRDYFESRGVNVPVVFGNPLLRQYQFIEIIEGSKGRK